MLHVVCTRCLSGIIETALLYVYKTIAQNIKTSTKLVLNIKLSYKKLCVTSSFERIMFPDLFSVKLVKEGFLTRILFRFYIKKQEKINLIMVTENRTECIWPMLVRKIGSLIFFSILIFTST